MAEKSKFFTVVIVPSSHGKVRRITIPRFVITAGIIGLIVGSFALFYFIGEYKIIKARLTHFRNLKKLVQTQQERIVSLNEKVAQLDKTLDRLREMEKKLKVMAGGGGGSEIEENVQGRGEFHTDILTDEPIVKQIKQNPLQTINKIESKLDLLQEEARVSEKNLAHLQKIVLNKKELFACTPNIFPVKGWISSGYGVRVNPFSGVREMHEAVDIVTSWGAPVRAACRGEVVYSGWRKLYGLVVEVKNEHGYSTVYAHLSKVLVKKEEKVDKGEVVGEVGSSGRSTGPHLHFEVWKRGETINPLNLMVEPLGAG